MEKNVKIIIGIVISLLGIIVLGSDYYLSLKHEVFDDMNKLYYYLKDGRSSLLNGKYSPYLLINNNGGKLTDRGVRYIIE